MDAEARTLLEELRAAQEEHARALQAANQVHETLDYARKEYEDARAAEKRSEDELVRAAEALAQGLQSLDLSAAASELQSPTPRVADSLVEYHANIGCYQCYLFLESHRDDEKEEEATHAFDVAQLGVRVQFPRVELTHRSSNSEDEVDVVWGTEIERNVDVSQCVVEDKDDHWYLRLPIRSSDKQPLGGFSSFTQVSPIELRPESYGSVCCRGCSALLLGGGGGDAIEKVLPLPSANWMDMFDFWGAGIGAFEHIPRDDIHAQRRRVLVGESYVLVHGSDLVDEATVANHEDNVAVAPGDNAKEEREWRPLACATCSERVGLCSVEQPDTVRLHKHLVVAHRRVEAAVKGSAGQEEDNVFGKYTIDSILSAKLLEMADSDGIFRFVLTSSNGKHAHGLTCGKEGSHPPPAPAAPTDSQSTELQLQLLSWETMIKQKDASKFRRVLKVLYGPRQPMPAIPGLLPSHEVTLPPAMCLSIAQRLQRSSTLLPSSLRTFNRMNVGYLFA
ncbi:Ubiquitin-conjugating enzyme E2-binding protein [Phytophthora cinnamomi]|uniref:Ubiquitin-conjugating enzyme E2-binding protein n=1 Tax=Phytophthora cinnamomi TaxID=4785 RepID=UPI00355AC784|nr:Ubiquitin-conjugating enzyme E2-binding protein [Phytophthora cinnamomi]